ncbi:Pyrethroid hydrolase [Madurella mycetomatis]|uniref:Pyrethroid hydrolase n=1 Tax=Madurella mycetomatis TaxID=100816 RepID=A0A175VQH3_9PEZI|nr:Pyrethroid hydrolase [Madurella mycetomatis]
MPSSNPVLVLVPGAFGTPAGFDKLLPYLSEGGVTTHPGPYPSCNPSDPATATCAEDISWIRNNVLFPLLDQQQKDVVILAHSYGGVVGGAAAKGLDVQTRKAQGKTTAVVGLIYVTCIITLEGESLLEAVGGTYPPFIKEDKPSKGLALIEPAMDILYNDCDAGLAPELDSAMRPHALLAFETKPSAPAWADRGFDGRRAYVRTLDDCCSLPFLQDMCLEKTKVKWDVVDFKTGHMPFVSQPEALAAQIVKWVNGFAAL